MWPNNVHTGEQRKSFPVIRIEPETIAVACNADERFSLATVPESVESIEILLVNADFVRALARIGPHNIPPTLGALVSAVYVCRVAENRFRKRVLTTR